MLSECNDVASVGQGSEDSEATFHRWRNRIGGINAVATVSVPAVSDGGALRSRERIRQRIIRR